MLHFKMIFARHSVFPHRVAFGNSQQELLELDKKNTEPSGPASAQPSVRPSMSAAERRKLF
jgi:hypothetical protein